MFPFPFDCYYAAEVDNANQVEEKLHNFFMDKRVGSKKGFLQVTPEQVKKVLEFATVIDVTPKDITPKRDHLANPTNVDAARREPVISPVREKTKEAMFLIREKMIAVINQKRGITLRRSTRRRKMRAEYEDSITETQVRLIISKRYNNNNNYHYWFELHKYQISFFEEGKQGYVCFGFTDKKIACLVPIADISSMLENCGTTEQGDQIGYHFFIKENHNQTLAFYFPKTGQEYDLSKYIINLD